MPLTAVLKNRSLRLALAASLAMTLLGPFGTHGELALVERFFYWSALLVGGTGICISIGRGLERFAGSHLSGWRHKIALVLLASVPISVAVILLSGPLQLGQSWADFGTAYWYALIVTGLMVALGELASLARQGHEAKAAAQSEPALERHNAPRTDTLPGPLPDTLRGREILALAAEDHYLRIYTDAGNDLILMRLRDAADALKDTDGLQVHRSYWAARTGIAGTTRVNGRLYLKLKTGENIPVSRSYLPAVRERGWLADRPSLPS